MSTFDHESARSIAGQFLQFFLIPSNRTEQGEYVAFTVYTDDAVTQITRQGLSESILLEGVTQIQEHFTSLPPVATEIDNVSAIASNAKSIIITLAGVEKTGLVTTPFSRTFFLVPYDDGAYALQSELIHYYDAQETHNTNTTTTTATATPEAAAAATTQSQGQENIALDSLFDASPAAATTPVPQQPATPVSPSIETPAAAATQEEFVVVNTEDVPTAAAVVTAADEVVQQDTTVQTTKTRVPRQPRVPKGKKGESPAAATTPVTATVTKPVIVESTVPVTVVEPVSEPVVVKKAPAPEPTSWANAVCPDLVTPVAVVPAATQQKEKKTGPSSSNTQTPREERAPRPVTTIFVGSLPLCDEGDIRHHFESFGIIDRINYNEGKNTVSVTYKSPEHAQAAVAHGQFDLRGKKLRASLYRAPSHTTPRNTTNTGNFRPRGPAKPRQAA